LRKPAQARGIDPARLVFAERPPPDEGLARHRCAEPFLDTPPYNGHATNSVASWADIGLSQPPRGGANT
jgi:predicted O-linked N-acetylglucosamine transferase (SPINDLY family)